MSVSDEGNLSSGIAGKCVLVVEDDYLVAQEVCDDLRRHGVHVLGPAPTVHYASLIIGKRSLDGAILDIKLYGEEVYELADVLMARGVPIVFATAREGDGIDARYSSVETLHKPFDLASLRRKIAAFRPFKPLGVRGESEPVARQSAEHIVEPAQDRWARLLFEAMRSTALPDAYSADRVIGNSTAMQRRTRLSSPGLR